MNAVPYMIIFITMLVTAIVASVIALSVAAHLEYKANEALSDLNCVLSHPEDPTVCDLNLVTGGVTYGEAGSR